MLFTSYGFILFVALLIGVYYIFPKRYQWTLLLVASYFFYAFSGLENFAFIIFTTLTCFFVSRAIERMRAREDENVALNKETMDKDARKAYRAKEKKKRFYILIVSKLYVYKIKHV